MKYTKTINNNIITFSDYINNKTISITHSGDTNCSDILMIDKGFNYDFIDYVLKELNKSNDLKCVISTFYDDKLFKIMEESNYKLLSYEYKINKSLKLMNKLKYNSTNLLNNNSKNYFLKKINEISSINYEYLYGQPNLSIIDENWFKNDDYNYLIYENNNEIVGIVDYKVYRNNNESNNTSVFDVSDMVCIRCLFGENKEIMKMLVRDLICKFNKSVIINCQYTNNELKEVIEELNGKLRFVQFLKCDYYKKI